MKRTPTPWKLDREHDRVCGADGEPLAVCGVMVPIGYVPREHEGYANAAFICRAVNAHDEMLAALKELLRCKSDPSGPQSGNIVTGEMKRKADEQARAAIAKASGTQS